MPRLLQVLRCGARQAVCGWVSKIRAQQIPRRVAAVNGDGNLFATMTQKDTVCDRNLGRLPGQTSARYGGIPYRWLVRLVGWLVTPLFRLCIAGLAGNKYQGAEKIDYI